MVRRFQVLLVVMTAMLNSYHPHYCAIYNGTYRIYFPLNRPVSEGPIEYMTGFWVQVFEEFGTTIELTSDTKFHYYPMEDPVFDYRALSGTFTANQDPNTGLVSGSLREGTFGYYAEDNLEVSVTFSNFPISNLK